MKKPLSIQELLEEADIDELEDFIIAYAEKNAEFRLALVSKFSPAAKIIADKNVYADMVRAAFKNNSLDLSDFHVDDYGFDGFGVSEDLEVLMDKAAWFTSAGYFMEAIFIYQAIIEIVPNKWDYPFDEDGEVRYLYEEAIEQLDGILVQHNLAPDEKEKLFEWLYKEYENPDHINIGLNEEIGSLFKHFIDTPERLKKILSFIDEEINKGYSQYATEQAVLLKIEILLDAGMPDKAWEMAQRYNYLPLIKEMQIEILLGLQKLPEAIKLIKDVLKKETNQFSVLSWNDRLFNIYIEMNDLKNAINMAEEMLTYDNVNGKKYYDFIKNNTSKEEWPSTIEKILNKIPEYEYGLNTFKADILAEHNMMEELFRMCSNTGAESFELYEKHLKPFYSKEILVAFHKYAEQQAAITDKEAYANVARILKKMKQYEGGKAIVEQLLTKYRNTYKRRKNMMEALKEV